MTDEFNRKANGSTFKEISGSTLAGIEVQIPPLLEQRAIAATLGALDDKIESNRRAIDVLQRLSAAAFTRWRNEAVTVLTSTFGAYADVYGGATPKTTVPDYWGGGLAWTTPTDVTGLSAPYLSKTSRTITNEGLQSCTAVMHPAGTIFMTSRATIGAFAINQVPAATNQGFIAVRPRREADRYFLFEEMRSRVDEFIDNANGSTFLEISRGRFKELPLEVPEPDVIAILDEQVGPLHRKAAQLALESNRLVALRDALLPELLSGRIRVPAEGVAA
jgi:type I restriction enzyme S subunit